MKITIHIEENNIHPCTYCSNNKRNNPYSSGICHCVLPTLFQERKNYGNYTLPFDVSNLKIT